MYLISINLQFKVTLTFKKKRAEDFTTVLFYYDTYPQYSLIQTKQGKILLQFKFLNKVNHLNAYYKHAHNKLQHQN